MPNAERIRTEYLGLNTECRTTTSADQSALCPFSSMQQIAARVGQSKLGFPFRRWPFPPLQSTPKYGSDHFRPGRHGRLRSALPSGEQKRSEDTKCALGELERVSAFLGLCFAHSGCLLHISSDDVYPLVFGFLLFSEVCRLSNTKDKRTADLLNRVMFWLRRRINCKHCVFVAEAPATPPVYLFVRRDARFIVAGATHPSTEDVTSNSNMAGFSTPRTAASSAWHLNGSM